MLATDDVVRQAIAGVSSLITSRQLINVDFADMRTVRLTLPPTQTLTPTLSLTLHLPISPR